MWTTTDSGSSRLVGVLGHQVDRAQALVVAVALGPAGDPVQDEVGGRHQDDVAGVGVERILARPERPFPDAALALGDALAVAERRRPKRPGRPGRNS